jgi:uncharacterized membrane protein
MSPDILLLINPLPSFTKSEITTTKSTTYLASPCFRTLVVAVLAVFIISAIITRPGTSPSFLLSLCGVSFPLVSDSVLSKEAPDYQCSSISNYLLDIANFFTVALPVNHIARPRVYRYDCYCETGSREVENELIAHIGVKE